MYTNRLVLEPSPYLQQHAHNPVDWYPWGDEAFARALAEGKPVLLSIGYSTCHWCHVMEEESFEDPEIAEYLNRHYIAVKVDRERRPDVDGVYMQAVQLMGERGGWPLTVWLTPGRQPFYGGTYFPARDGERGVRMGFLTVLRRVHEAFVTRPADVAAVSTDLTQRVRAAMTAPPGSSLPDESAIARAVDALRESYDAANGGFGGAPKFPRPVELELLLRQARRAGDAPAQAMAVHTLSAMAAGGIRDQLGGGFHRYATDARWLVPHFEKMLYDNALLAIAYLEAYQASGEAALAEVARDILAYVGRDMTAPSGAFYSASDADSEGEEGTYFLWTPEQFAAVLAPDDARLAAAYYALGAAPLEHGSVLHTPRSVAEVAAQLGVEPAIAARRLATARAALAGARQQRVPPATDHKILPAWNGLMISAFARAAFVFDDADYARRAARAADAVLRGMLVGGRLRRSSLDGAASGDAYLDDYAAMIVALLDLYEATAEPRWLAAAIDLEQIVDGHYRDAQDGGYFLTAADAEQLLAREKPAYDGAEPSGTSTLLLALLRLHEMTGVDRYRARAEDTLRAAAPALADNPLAMPRLLAALDFRLDRPKQIVLVARERADAEPFLAHLRRRFLPNRVLLIVSDANRNALAELAPIVADKTLSNGKAIAYVCERRVCDFPTTDPTAFARQLDPE